MYRFLLYYCILIQGTINSQPLIKHFIPVADSKVYVEETGIGPAVILLHAGNMDHRMWDGQVTVLSKQYRVINCDLRGCGLTQDGDSTYLQSDAILAIMDSLNIKKASFVGSSLGAVAATDFALTHPGRVNKMVLASPGLIGINLEHDSTLVNYQRQMATAFEKHDTIAYTELFIRSWFDGPYRKPSAVNKAVRKKAFTIAYETIRKRKAGVHLAFNYEPTQLERLQELHMPVMVIAGAKDMNDILMITDAWKKAGATTIVLPNVGHLLNMEQPILFSRYIFSFLH